MGVQKGQGVQAGCKNFWDIDTDTLAHESYIDDNIFCLVTVWGIYVYWARMIDKLKVYLKMYNCYTAFLLNKIQIYTFI